MAAEALAGAYERIQLQATALAGELADFSQRSAAYHQLYLASGGWNIFPLIAAHGALWGSRYFDKGMLAGWIFSLQFVFSPALRMAKLRNLRVFADAFADINRRVFIQAYSAYHFSALYGEEAGAEQFIDPLLLQHLNASHRAREQGEALTAERRQVLFEAFFLWEQATIVGPDAQAAVALLDWPSIKYFALRPRVEFLYFPTARHMKFTDFANTQERIEKGFRAYAMAEAAGLAVVESSLRGYKIPPVTFFSDSASYLNNLRKKWCLYTRYRLAHTK